MKLDSVDTPIHLLLHGMMAYDEVMGVLRGIKLIETQEENARVLRTHPYYALHEHK